MVVKLPNTKVVTFEFEQTIHEVLYDRELVSAY